jgi:hypothetical protein
MSLLTIGPSSDPGLTMIEDFISAQQMLSTGPSDFGPPWFVFVPVWPVVPTVLIAGGNWNNGLSAGLAAANANNALSNSNSNIGARLAYTSRIKASNITLGKDPATWQKITKNNHPTGRRAYRYARPNVGTRFLGDSVGVCR